MKRIKPFPPEMGEGRNLDTQIMGKLNVVIFQRVFFCFWKQIALTILLPKIIANKISILEGKAKLRKKVDALLYNLFRETPKDLKLLRMQEINEDAWVMSTNFNFTVKLMRYQQKIDTKIDPKNKDITDGSLKSNPTDIHAWINKAMYHILIVSSDVSYDLNQAKEAYEKALKLLGHEGAASEAKIQYAYWLCTMMNDDLNKREEGIEIFREELSTQESDPRHHYLYMKVLGIHLNRLPANVTKSQKTEIAREFRDQIQYLNCSESPNFKMQMFLYLADVQRHDTGKIILGELENLRLPFGRPSIKFCIKQIDQILNGHKSIPLFANFYARIGLCLLKDAWEGNPNEIEDNLNTALSYAEQYKNYPESRFQMGAITCARIILAQWAVKYFAEKKDKLQLPHQKLRKSTAQYYFHCFVCHL